MSYSDESDYEEIEIKTLDFLEKVKKNRENGEKLVFDVNKMEVREQTKEDIEHTNNLKKLYNDDLRNDKKEYIDAYYLSFIKAQEENDRIIKQLNKPTQIKSRLEKKIKIEKIQEYDDNDDNDDNNNNNNKQQQKQSIIEMNKFELPEPVITEIEEENHQEYTIEQHNNEIQSYIDRIDKIQEDYIKDKAAIWDIMEIIKTEEVKPVEQPKAVENSTQSEDLKQWAKQVVKVKEAPYDIKHKQQLQNELADMRYKYHKLAEKFNKLKEDNKQLKKSNEETAKYKAFYDKYNTNEENNKLKKFINDNYEITNDRKDKIKCINIYNDYIIIDNTFTIQSFIKALNTMNIHKCGLRGYNYFYCIKSKLLNEVGDVGEVGELNEVNEVGHVDA